IAREGELAVRLARQLALIVGTLILNPRLEFVVAVPAGEEIRHRFVGLVNPLSPPLRVVAGRSDDRRREAVARDLRELLEALAEVEDARSHFVHEAIADDPGFADNGVLVVGAIVVPAGRRRARADRLVQPQL